MTQPYSTILAIDYETRWSSKPCAWSPDEAYTLSKLTTEEYIRNPLFKAFGACIHEVGSDRRTQWYSHEELPNILSTYDWDKTAVLAHNAMFDVGILSFVYDIKPCFIFDSLSMARALRGVEVGNSLAKLAAAYELPDKGQALASTNGLFEITPEIEKELAAYCAHDVYLCEQIFSRLLLGVTPEGEVGRPYPKSELRLISMTLKMFTEPELILDVPMLEKAKLEDAEKLEAALVKAGVAESDLASNEQFAELLEQLGVPRPMKTSKTTGKPALALAKTDALFQAMLNGDNEAVALLCEARLKVKSTGERTRAQRFLGIASRGPLPVPLNYYGAGTGRYAACLVAETKVLVYDAHVGQCEKNIVDVLPDDLVWDGIDFVPHKGVQFNGYREVMHYDGVTGTEDHEVFLTDTDTCSLAFAAGCGAKLMVADTPDTGSVDRARAFFKRNGR